MYKVAHIDKHRSEKNKLTASKNKQLVQLSTSFQNYADVFSRLGYPVNLDFTSIFMEGKGDISLLPSQIFTDKAGVIHSSGDKQSPWIGIAPFAAHKGKIYPIDKMEKVIQQLIHTYPQVRLYLFGGGKEETAIMNQWAETYPQVINASSQLNGLAQELNLMSQLQLMISMDSGNMHLASLVNTPVISIWGATHPYAGFMGWNQDDANAVQVSLPCRPCSIYGNKPCLRGDYACLNEIQPEEIINKVKFILQ